jgi:RNA polymerase sigma-70 factor (ECF subfamily)
VSPQERFRELAATYAPAMRRLCAAYARGSHDREDLFQNIFLAIWKALPGYRGDSSERTWIYSIAHNVALTWQARERRWLDRRRDLDEASTTAEAPASDRRAQLYALISRLPPVDRQLVILWLEGFTGAEIAAVAGMQPNAVAVRLTRIRQSLSETLRPMETRHE